MSTPIKKITIAIEGTSLTVAVCAKLVMRSVYFECTPLPDDFYEITVKIEHENIIKEALKQILC